GYTSAKLYFMCGLPGENDDDLRAILDLSLKAHQRAREVGNKNFRITVSVSPHVPKPHTPFAWAEQVSTAELNRRLGVLRDAARGKPVQLKYRDAETSLLEGVFTRGDRRLGQAVEMAWLRGCRFDAWSEHLRFNTWLEVFSDLGMDPERQLIERDSSIDQPWEVVQSPVTKKFLVRDKVRAEKAGVLEDCRLEDVCFSCGVAECPQRPWVKQPHAPLDLEQARAAIPPPSFGRRARRSTAAAPAGVDTATRFRILFEKGIEMRFTSHLDLMRTWERTLRRSGLPLSFTQGHHPHLKMSFGPPLPLGYRSRAEVFDLEFSKPPAVDLVERLNAVLPEGLRVIACRPILFKSPSLMSQLEG
ncbi:MAG: TIGR03936 family radical SAM-associated protein, partial [Gaiellaceae bacterium]